MLPVRDIVRGDLVVRRYRQEDARALVTAVVASMEHLRPWMPWIAGEPRTVAERRDFIAEVIRAWDEGRDMTLGMFVGDELVGGCGLHWRGVPGRIDIGYWVHVGHTGKGYATAAASALTSAAFLLPGIELVEIHHDQANVRSGRVPERLGYTMVATAPDERTSPGEVGVDCTWRMLRADWNGGPAWAD